MNDLSQRCDEFLTVVKVGAWDWRLDSDRVIHNQLWCEMLGLDQQHLEQGFDTWIERLHPDDVHSVKRRIQRALESGEEYSSVHRMLRADGSVIWVEDLGRVVDRSPSGKALRMLGGIRDVTDMMQVTHALEASETRFSHLASNMPGAVFRYIVHPDGSDEIEYMSPGCMDIWEMPAEEIRRDPAPLWEMVHPEDFPGFKRSVEQSARTLEFWSYRWRVTTPSGKVKWLFGRGTPAPLEGGSILWNSVILDISDQVATELELNANRELLHQAQKMDALGKLTGGMAHDFNNLLAVIISSLELLAEESQELADTELIANALNATLRGRELTGKLLSFARQAALEPVRLDLNEVILEMNDLFQRTLPATIQIETDLAPDLQTVMADRNSTESALLNLVINARDAMPDGGRLTIRTANVTVNDARREGIGADIAPGSYVMVAVEDSGEGIPEEILPMIFEPFFTTKEAGRGSGLGLSMVMGFARQSGGTVVVKSLESVGTSMRIYFTTQQAKGSGSPERRRGEADPEARGVSEPSARILLVEDEPDVRRAMVRLLRHGGYRVEEADSGAAALAKHEQHGPFDLLLTDIVMPGELQGPELARRLCDADPALKVIFLSGYPHEASTRASGPMPGAIQLMKPVTRAELHGTIQSMLSPPRR